LALDYYYVEIDVTRAVVIAWTKSRDYQQCCILYCTV